MEDQKNEVYVKKVLLANPRGFCAGVYRAIAIVERALQVYGAPIYVRHEIVHNKHVVNRLKSSGSVFVDELDEVPDGAVLVFSAHGVPKAIEEKARSRNLTIFDATCPLVRKVHAEVKKMYDAGYQIVMIGHAGHPEVEGTVGQVPTEIQVIEKKEEIEKLKVSDKNKIAYVSQTTISLDDARSLIQELKGHYPNIKEPKKADICYATQNRQDAVKKLARESDIIIVVGSKTSSNSNRLREVAEGVGTKAFLIDDASELKKEWFDNVDVVGVTAGASAPEILVEEIVEVLKMWGAETIETCSGVEEKVEFPLPKGLWKKDLEKSQQEK